MVKLSVIVPVYNAEKYLKQCIDSILTQSYGNMEIILVDDGSTDHSGEICDWYKNKYKNVKTLHQKNAGVIAARRQGIQSSKGEYIGFVDSDDWIDSDMYQTLMLVAEEQNCDVVSMGYKSEYGDRTKERDDATIFGIYQKGRNMDVLLSTMMYDVSEKRRSVHPSLCTKVIKKELLVDAFSNIDENITLGEDAAVFYPCCLHLNKICILREYQYHYRIQRESMCRSLTINAMSRIDCFYRYMQNILSKYPQKYELQKQLKMYVWDFVKIALKQVFDMQPQQKYIFPYSLVGKDTAIVLYGAGKVGESYYEQILENRYCNIVAWVDKNKKGRQIILPEEMLDLEYSWIVIAIENEETAMEIIEELRFHGIPERKICWSKPQKVCWEMV